MITFQQEIDPTNDFIQYSPPKPEVVKIPQTLTAIN